MFLWLACAVAACAGAYIVFGVLGAAVDRQVQLAGTVAERMLADARIIAQRPQLEREERSIDARLRALSLQTDTSTIVARFIRSAAAVAEQQHVAIERVEAGAATPTKPVSGEFAMETIPLDVDLHGTYRDLLAAVRALAQLPLALRIDIAALERTTGPSVPATDTPLTAHLRVTIERLGNATALAATSSAP